MLERRMPNIFAYLVFYTSPLLVVILFRKLQPVQALCWSMVLGYLFLPLVVSVELPAFPTIGKYEIVTLATAFMCFFVVKEAERLNRFAVVTDEVKDDTPVKTSRARPLTAALVILVVAGPLATVLSNSEPIIAGPKMIPGLRMYDALSIISGLLITVLPFLIALKFLNTSQSHLTFLRVLCVAMIAYAWLALFEVRMSPQLNVWFYGFFPHSFSQHVRAGGYRPLVFLEHGLSLGIILSMSILGALTLWRTLKGQTKRAYLWLLAAFWLFFTLVLSKNVGALVITLALSPLILLTKVRLQLLVAAILAGVVLLYPMLRGADLIPTDKIHEIALSYSEKRAQSLNYRLENEDRLLEKANLKPLVGWGSWGRNHIFSQVTGNRVSVTDGYWVIAIGSFGWLGYVAQFGLLTLPIILMSINRRKLRIPIETSGLALVMAANLVDLLPNAALTPITWLLAGGLMGRYIAIKEDALNPSSAADVAPQDPDEEEEFVPEPVLVRQPRAKHQPPQRGSIGSVVMTQEKAPSTKVRHARQPRIRSTRDKIIDQGT